MRITPLLFLGAGLASAAPLNVIVTSEVPAPRLGRPAIAAGGNARLRVFTVDALSPQQPPSRIGHLCSKMKSGVTQLMSLAGLGPAVPQDITAFAALPVTPPYRPPGQGGVVIRPTWNKPVEVIDSTNEEGIPMKPHQRHHHHHHFRPHAMHRRCSFLRRIHRALMTLGPWEGRAVAFVLGCGIGVLLRMVWVFTVLVARAVRGDLSDEPSEGGYEQVAVLLPLDVEAEEIFVAPPEYTDEKQQLREETKV